MRMMRCILLLTSLVLAAPANAQFVNTANCLNVQEAELARIVNDYRAANGLTRIAVSHSLSSVGQWHVWDLHTNNPVVGNCNLHSWSNARPALWQAMCYTSDHAQAAQMWNKPRQITGNAYDSDGYENAAVTGGTMTAALALQLWQGSPLHNDVILNRQIWSSLTWRAIGVGVSQRHAVLWFGTLADPLGTMEACDAGSESRIFHNSFQG